jgi:hypothetical protein
VIVGVLNVAFSCRDFFRGYVGDVMVWILGLLILVAFLFVIVFESVAREMDL